MHLLSVITRLRDFFPTTVETSIHTYPFTVDSTVEYVMYMPITSVRSSRPETGPADCNWARGSARPSARVGGAAAVVPELLRAVAR